MDVGEVICDACNGTGLQKSFSDNGFYLSKDICIKCHGFKTLDWIDMIKGGKEEYLPIEDLLVDCDLNYGPYGQPDTFSISDEPPKHPKEDDIFFNCISKEMYIFDDDEWKSIYRDDIEDYDE